MGDVVERLLFPSFLPSPFPFLSLFILSFFYFINRSMGVGRRAPCPLYSYATVFNALVLLQYCSWDNWFDYHTRGRTDRRNPLLVCFRWLLNKTHPRFTKWTWAFHSTAVLKIICVIMITLCAKRHIDRSTIKNFTSLSYQSCFILSLQFRFAVFKFAGFNKDKSQSFYKKYN